MKDLGLLASAFDVPSSFEPESAKRLLDCKKQSAHALFCKGIRVFLACLVFGAL